jgi:NAD(P)-dependent dehydrogenase (short-subunit alcohol dehydrogenase family)
MIWEEIMAQRVWMITGASRGFGAEMAKAVLASGIKLWRRLVTPRVLHIFNPQSVDNPNIYGTALDVTDEAQVRGAEEAALNHFGQIDVLVNNAGYGLMGAVEESSATEVERHQFLISRWIWLWPGFGVYCSTKFAVEGMTGALHGELAPLGIHVTVVEPGYF